MLTVCVTLGQWISKISEPSEDAMSSYHGLGTHAPAPSEDAMSSYCGLGTHAPADSDWKFALSSIYSLRLAPSVGLR